MVLLNFVIINSEVDIVEILKHTRAVLKKELFLFESEINFF